jgi:hypothetical protein
MVFVSSAKHIKELDSTPDDVLSLNGAAKHVISSITAMKNVANISDLDAPTHIHHERLQLVR